VSGDDRSRIRSWLKRRIYGGCAVRLLASLGTLALGVGIVFVEYWLVVGLCYIVLGQLGVDASYFPLIAGAFLLLLFIGNARTDRRYLSAYSVSTGTYSDEVVTFYLPGAGMVSNINPLAPDTMHTGIKMITSVLYTGPRAVMAAFRYSVDAIRLAVIDTTACAAVIDYLYQRPNRAAFAMIMENVPDLNPVATFPQVSRIDGVLVLKSEPAGLTLSSELRSALNDALDSASGTYQ